MAASFQKRLKTVMKQREWRMADLARALDRPYTTVREWVLEGRRPMKKDERLILKTLEEIVSTL